MKHPLENLPLSSRKPLFWPFLIGTVILLIVFIFMDAPLQPYSIVAFEFAGNTKNTADILLTWDEHADLFAAFGLDYLFMPVYATALALSILLAAGKHRGWFEILGTWLGWGAFAAALFDAVENYALARMLLMDEIRSSFPEMAALCAAIKFGLLGLGLIYALAGWLWSEKT